jgi:predicted nucleic acid-binding protein
LMSTQVLQEYFAVATCKMGVDIKTARSKVDIFSRFEVVLPSAQMVLDAIDLHDRQNISFWDAMILQAAINSGCAQLWSEDMQHGRTIGGVRIVNPFVE